ncbi:hypothetical protein ACS0TY_033952 [Phlomoides rotata]
MDPLSTHRDFAVFGSRPHQSDADSSRAFESSRIQHQLRRHRALPPSHPQPPRRILLHEGIQNSKS